MHQWTQINFNRFTPSAFVASREQSRASHPTLANFNKCSSALISCHRCSRFAISFCSTRTTKFLSTTWISAAQHINFISPQNTENGDPKIRNWDGPGNSGKVRVSVVFPQISDSVLKDSTAGSPLGFPEAWGKPDSLPTTRQNCLQWIGKVYMWGLK